MDSSEPQYSGEESHPTPDYDKLKDDILRAKKEQHIKEILYFLGMVECFSIAFAIEVFLL